MFEFDLTDLYRKDEGRRKLADQLGLDLALVRPHFTRAEQCSCILTQYNNFVDSFPDHSKNLNKLRSPGIGPGEILFYLLFDDVGLGGQNSHIDLLLAGDPWVEVKAGRLLKKENCISNFKINRDGDLAGATLLADLESFNKRHKQFSGKELAGWRTPGSIKVKIFKEWETVDLEELAKLPRFEHELILKNDGRIFFGDRQLMNVFTDTSAYLLYLLQNPATLTQAELAVSTLRKIIAKWREATYSSYVINKTFALLETKTAKLLHFGQLKEEQLDLYCTHRNHPWAKIHLS